MPPSGTPDIVNTPASKTRMKAHVSTAVLAFAMMNESVAETSVVSEAATARPNLAPSIDLTSPAGNLGGIVRTTKLGTIVSDPEGDPQTVTFYGRHAAPAAPGPDFTVIAIPDTQFYCENNGRNAENRSIGAKISFFNDQTQWIAANRIAKNIAFVAHMGDMVQNGDAIEREWILADLAMKKIEDPKSTELAHGIPWGGAPGNHDFGSGGGNGRSNFWNQYFGTARWAGRSYFRGNFGSDNTNNYQFFSASGLDFIVINLAYRSTSDTAVLEWADALLKAYPSRRAIITSHWIIGSGASASFGGQGQAIYNQLKDNPNLFLLLCGHIHGEGRRLDIFEDRTVYSILQDYQDAANGGNGFLRTLTFSPTKNQITAEMWSPTLNRTAGKSDLSTALGTFTLPYKMQNSLSEWIALGTVNIPANSSTASFDWTGLEPGKNYEWHAKSSDGLHTVSSDTRRFETVAP